MKRLVVLVPALVLASCGSGVKDVSATGAWARFTPTNAAAYVTVKNTSRDADALVSVSVPNTVADKAEIHKTTTVDHDMFGMQTTPTVDLPTSFTLTMNPGGYHIMLTELRATPAVGTSFPVTLTFAHHAPIVIDAEVRA